MKFIIYYFQKLKDWWYSTEEKYIDFKIDPLLAL
jgi:hypothetical protein